VLAAVVLHTAKAYVPIKLALYRITDGQGRFAEMHHFLTALTGVGYPYATDKAHVTELSSALGKECGPVEDDLKSPVFLLTGEDGRLKALYVAVNIIKSLCHL
jgi:hypothetical protein